MNLRDRLRTRLQRAGYDLHRYTRPVLLRQQGVTVVFDVGAYVGEYGRELRRHGYTGRIVSFEPRRTPFDVLARRAAADPVWKAVHAGLGRAEGEATIHVSGRDAASSLLPMRPAVTDLDAALGTVAEETIQITTLAAAAAAHLRDGDRPFLKVDTQGYERAVLDGGAAVLDRFVGVQIELSLVSLYEGDALLPELAGVLYSRGFVLVGVEPGFRDPVTGHLLQMDGVFFRAPGAAPRT